MRSKIAVEILDDEILVTMPGTSALFTKEPRIVSSSPAISLEGKSRAREAK
jgi:hypothetical protein